MQDNQRGKQEQRQILYKVICTMAVDERVPAYRFHHVEITENILAPNSRLLFIPYLKDLEGESSEEKRLAS